MAEDLDPITKIGMDYGCMSCGTKTDKFYFVEYYILPSKLVRKQHRDKNRFALYCCSCYEAHDQLHIEVDGKPLTVNKSNAPDLNNLRCFICGSEMLHGALYAPNRQQLVIPDYSIVRTNLWRDFGVICKRAGLERWADWCQVLRRNCETDWAQKYPQYAVSTWIGHNIQVSARHYLQVPEELYEKVAATNSVETATKTATNCEKEEVTPTNLIRKPF